MNGISVSDLQSQLNNDLVKGLTHHLDENSSSDTDSDEDDDVKISTANIGERQRAPPIITWQHTWPMNETHQALSKSPFLMLPVELVMRIFRSLDVHDLGNASLVCRYFKLIADHDDIWRSKCNPSDQIQSKTFKEIYMNWIYGKYVRRQSMEKVQEHYRRTRVHIPCQLARCHCSSNGLVQRMNPRVVAPTCSSILHPKSSSDVTIPLSVDIDRTIIALIALLEKASEFFNDWNRPTIVEQMIMRYYRFLQLKALYPDKRLVPTLDIEIIWQTHLLRPEMYRGDCLRLFRRIIDHSLLVDSDEEHSKKENFAQTCHLYEKHFGDEYGPLPTSENRVSPAHSLLDYIECLVPPYSYWDETSFRFKPERPKHYQNPFSFVEADVILDSYWLKIYYIEMYAVGLKIIAYESEAQQAALTLVMKRLRKSYERFLYLVAKYSTRNEYDCIHPTYAIDLVWHAHMQEPLHYADDCQRFLGFVMEQIPWSPMATHEQMIVSYEKANKAWKEEFDRDLETDHLE